MEPERAVGSLSPDKNDQVLKLSCQAHGQWRVDRLTQEPDGLSLSSVDSSLADCLVESVVPSVGSPGKGEGLLGLNPELEWVGNPLQQATISRVTDHQPPIWLHHGICAEGRHSPDLSNLDLSTEVW